MRNFIIKASEKWGRRNLEECGVKRGFVIAVFNMGEISVFVC